MTIKLCECGCGQEAPLAPKTIARKGYRRGEPMRFIHGHNSTRVKTPLQTIFSQITLAVNGCWLWTGYIQKGYARASINGKQGTVHRWLYQQANGPLASSDQVLHHTCESKHCVNPLHLEVITQGDHARLHGLAAIGRPHLVAKRRSATHCQRGHSYAEYGETTSNGWRRCGECRRWRAQRK